MYPEIDSTQCPVCDWSKFYDEIKEPTPPNAPEAMEKVADFCKFFDIDQAGDQ